MLIDFIRQIKSQQNFKIADTFEFVEFDDMTHEGLSEDEAPEQLEIWAQVKLNYEGAIPESYKAFNLIIGDWVQEHVAALTKVIHSNLHDHFRAFYEGSEVDLNDEETAIWLDQLEYMPRPDPDTHTILIEVELVILAEPLEE
jgi:hypothetical protein